MRKILLLLVFFVFSFVSASGQNLVGEILKRMEQHRLAMRSLHANITITRFSVQFGGAYAKEGTVKYLPGKNDYSLRMDSTKPVPESFVIVNNQYALYLPDLKTAHNGKTTESQNNLFFLFSNSPRENLRANYDIRYLGEEKVNGTTPTWHLELKPKNAKTFQAIDVWVDGNGMAVQSKIVENEGEWTTVLLENLQKNLKMKATDFKVNLPKGTNILNN